MSGGPPSWNRPTGTPPALPAAQAGPEQKGPCWNILCLHCRKTFARIGDFFFKEKQGQWLWVVGGVASWAGAVPGATTFSSCAGVPLGVGNGQELVGSPEQVKRSPGRGEERGRELRSWVPDLAVQPSPDMQVLGCSKQRTPLWGAGGGSLEPGLQKGKRVVAFIIVKYT